jgi:hypothetical protein
MYSRVNTSVIHMPQPSSHHIFSLSLSLSLSLRLTCCAGKIMDEKIKGEDTVRDLYRSAEGCAYTVIRPGGLTEDPALGVAALELNQGDTKSGRISRADVASLCIESVFYPKSTAGTTFECYDADTGKPLESVGFSNILKQKSAPAEFVSGQECRGASFEQIFSGLEKDA